MFGRRVKLFSLLGFEVKIDFSWIILAVLIAWSLSTGFFPFRYENLSTQTYWIMGIVGAIGLFLSIIVHEFSHSVVARRHGMPMKGITLFIFGGVAEMGDEPPNPKAEFSMAIVGPLSSIAIAVIFYAIYRTGEGAFSDPVLGVIGYLAFINAILAGFNLIPAFPLDGGRVLRSILWHIKGKLQWATKVSSRIGAGFGVLLMILGVLNVLGGNFVGGMWWFILGMFLQGAAKASYQRLLMRRSLEGETVRRFMSTSPVAVKPTETIRDTVEDYVYKHHYKFFPVVENGGKVVGCVTTKQIKEVPKEEWDRKTVGEIASECSPENSIAPDKDAIEALSAMRSDGASRLMVLEGDRLVGIISLKDLLELISLRVELEE